MNQKPLVSLVIPTLNQADFILDSLKSIWNQDYPNIEIIIIDGGSTDGTLDIINANIHRIQMLVSEPDNGTSDAINKGWRNANGEFIWALSSDDSLANNHVISDLVDQLQRSPDTMFVYGDMRMINHHGKGIGIRRFNDYDVYQLLTDRRHLPWPGCLMRRSVLDRIGYFNEELKYSNDLDFFLRLANDSTLLHLQNITGEFRLHDDASTQSYTYYSGLETKQVCEQALKKNLTSFSPIEIKNINASIAHFTVVTYFHAGLSRKTRAAMYLLLKKHIRYITAPKLWIYFFATLGGNSMQTTLARISRKLLRSSITMRINNSTWFSGS